VQRPKTMRALIVTTVLMLASVSAVAGGIYVREVQFVEGQAVVAPGTPIKLEFLAEDYAYGGKLYAYVALAVIPETESLRPNAAALARWPIYGIVFATSHQDVAGLTEGAAPYSFAFRAPQAPGRYKVVINRVPMFRDQQFRTDAGYKQSFVPHPGDRNELAASIAQYPGVLQVIAQLEVTSTLVTHEEAPSVYLKLNGRIPSDVRLPGGLQTAPLTFSWEVGPEFKKDRTTLLYRYRLLPEDDDWGAWTSQKQVSYAFLLKGIHQFQVQAKYTSAAKVIESPPAKYQFNLPKDHVSRPTRETLTKAPFGSAATAGPPIAFDQVYAKSRALLIGLWKFDDAAHLPQFDERKIAADIGAMKTALTRNGFEVVTVMRDRVQREDIVNALSALVDASGRDDRLFVYFSTHGFPDPTLPSDAYLATSDCQVMQAPVRCLRLNDLETHAERALNGKRVRQVLFAVDSCFSGLGIARKSPVVTDLTRLAVPQGAFMLTAGMADQLAQIDPTLGMSTFTHYLAEGLSGKADLLGNGGLITLSELFVYVQYKVAEKTGAHQIPMLGRMKGDGEMLFLPATSR